VPAGKPVPAGVYSRPDKSMIALSSPSSADIAEKATVPQAAVRIQTPQTAFDWGDAGIGAAGGIVIAMLATGSGLLAVRTRRDHLDPTTRSEGTMRFKIARALLIALVATGANVGVALLFTSPASAQSSACADAVTSAPTGPATVSAASTSFGRVLVVSRRFGPVRGLFPVPAHLRPAPRADRRAVRV